MKYLVTGTLGHVAPHLIKLLLSKEHTVHALIRGSNGNQYNLLDVLTPEEIEKVTFHFGDLIDYNSLEKIFKSNKFDGLFHLGAQSHPPTAFKDPIYTMRVNTLGTVYLIELIKAMPSAPPLIDALAGSLISLTTAVNLAKTGNLVNSLAHDVISSATLGSWPITEPIPFSHKPCGQLKFSSIPSTPASSARLISSCHSCFCSAAIEANNALCGYFFFTS